MSTCDDPISRYGWVKTPKSQMIERLVRMRKIGFRIGWVTLPKTGAGGAVDLGGLDELARHLSEPCVDRDRHERDGAPRSAPSPWRASRTSSRTSRAASSHRRGAA